MPASAEGPAAAFTLRSQAPSPWLAVAIVNRSDDWKPEMDTRDGTVHMISGGGHPASGAAADDGGPCV